jgi:DNA-binding transcriptional MerR regulator
MNMTLSHEPLWTLEELSAQVALALAVDYPGQASGRVRDVPDIRTIRYYTTLGLMDRPARMHGRTAFYGERHLLQLVAIKRLQAKGQALAEILSRVVGQTETVLRQLAQLPVHRQQTVETEPPDRQQTVETEEARWVGPFWGALPADVPEGDTTAEPGEEGKKSRDWDVLPLLGVSLDEGVTLLLQEARSLDEQDVEALRVAAAPLLKMLKTRCVLDAVREAAHGETKGDAP